MYLYLILGILARLTCVILIHSRLKIDNDFGWKICKLNTYPLQKNVASEKDKFMYLTSFTMYFFRLFKTKFCFSLVLLRLAL